MLRDRAKNTIKTASNLKTLSATPIQRSDSVGPTDLNDLYRFNVGDRSSFNLTLTDLAKGSNADVEVYQLKRPKNLVLRDIGNIDVSKLSPKDVRRNVTRLGRSARSGKRNESIQLTLEAGEYYVRVFQRQGETNYKLNLFATSLLEPPIEPPPTEQPPIEPPPIPTLPKFTQAWLQQFGASGNDYAYGTTTDSAGNVYVAGVSGAGTGSAGSSFVAKYNSSGTEQWRKTLSDVPGNSVAFDVAVDSAGNYYVAGAANVSSNGSDGFVTKYDANGTPLWSGVKLIATQVTVPILGNQNALDAASGIAIDSQGNVFVSGFVKAFPTVNEGDAFIAKYDGNTGNAITAFGGTGRVEFAGAKADAASGVAIDSNDDVYIAGITGATLTTDPNNLLTGGDAFVAKYSGNNGSSFWNTTLASNSGQDYARGLAVDSSGNVYITGQTEGTLPSGTLPANTNAGGIDGFLASYSSSAGTLNWVQQFGTAGLEESQAIALDSAGNVYITGETEGSLFGNASLGGSDAWIANYDAAGKLVKSIQIGTSANDETNGITVDSSSGIYVTGQTQGAFTGFTNSGSYNAWIAKYGNG